MTTSHTIASNQSQHANKNHPATKPLTQKYNSPKTRPFHAYSSNTHDWPPNKPTQNPRNPHKTIFRRAKQTTKYRTPHLPSAKEQNTNTRTRNRTKSNKTRQKQTNNKINTNTNNQNYFSTMLSTPPELLLSPHKLRKQKQTKSRPSRGACTPSTADCSFFNSKKKTRFTTTKKKNTKKTATKKKKPAKHHYTKSRPARGACVYPASKCPFLNKRK